TAKRTRASAARRSALPRLRLLHGKRPAAECLIVQTRNRFLSVRVVAKLHERKPARPSRFAVGRQVTIGDRSDAAEVFAQLRLGGVIGQVPHEQTHWDGDSMLSVRKERMMVTQRSAGSLCAGRPPKIQGKGGV